jgi:hypothetical protein
VNKTYYLYSHSLTGNEIVSTLATVNGTKPTLVELTKADLDKDVQGGGFPAVMAATKRKWGENDWPWGGQKWEVDGWQKENWVEIASKFKA